MNIYTLVVDLFLNNKCKQLLQLPGLKLRNSMTVGGYYYYSVVLLRVPSPELTESSFLKLNRASF